MADYKEHEDGKNDEETAEEPAEDEEEMVNGEEDDSEFDDSEDYVDSATDEELIGDLLSQKPHELNGTDTVIAVDNVPSVGQERCDKLKNVIRKVFSKFGKIITEYYPTENGMTKGYIFLEFSNAADAARAVKAADGYKLDKHHIFAVNHFDDFNKLLDLEEEWKPPSKQEYEAQENLRSWLLDPDCNDQYSVIHGEKASILWNSPQEPMLVKERPTWTETYVLWSPKGTYLATFHGQGVALWGGEEFRRIMRFSHPGVQLLDFSPCERYMVSFSPVVSNQEDPTGIIIWDMRTGHKKRGFLSGDTSQWPAFKWSSNEKYFARMATDSISVYETPSFGLVEKRSIKIEGVKDFHWSPSDDFIAYWTPEDKDTPARVTIMEIPTRREIRVKNLFNVSECKIYWHNKGDYLAVKVDRYTKSKKALYYNFELFRIREKQIPVESIEMKEPIISFAWEPFGSKFCVLHGESTRISASFYNMENQGSVELQKTYEKRQANNIFWSPRGQFCVLAGLRSMNGILEFHDTSDWVCMNQAEHFMATDIEWDPTGRYLATSVSWWAHKVDNGYYIWTFQGKLLQRHAQDQFCQLLWRPRPVALLDDEALKKLKKEMKKYQKTFEVKDRMSQSRASKEIVEKRRRKFTEYESYRQKRENEFGQLKKQRVELRSGLETDNCEGTSKEVDVERIEFFVKEETIEVEE